MNAGVRQKRNYDVHNRGRHFVAGELVWVYSPLRKKGRCPKLDSHWVGPCSVLERVGEVVYWVQLPPRGRKVTLHRDRLAPYRGASSPQTPGTPTIPSLAMTLPRHPPPSATDQAPNGPRPLSPSLCPSLCPRVVPRSHGRYSPFLLLCPPHPYSCPLVLRGSALCHGWSLLFHIWTLCNLHGHACEGDLWVASETLFVPSGTRDFVATRTDICV